MFITILRYICKLFKLVVGDPILNQHETNLWELIFFKCKQTYIIQTISVSNITNIFILLFTGLGTQLIYRFSFSQGVAFHSCGKYKYISYTRKCFFDF